MYLRAHIRKKNGKRHRYFSVVENRRLADGTSAQRQVLYLGEINDSQEAAWRTTLEVFDERRERSETLALFPDDRPLPPDGLPLAYDVLPGNTADKTTLRDFLKKIETRYGKARRVWVMDRGIPTEEVLAEMRTEGVQYLVGTPKGRLTKLEKSFLPRPWRELREGVTVKLLDDSGELLVLARSADRVQKERAMRMRKLRKLYAGLRELQRQAPERDTLLLKLGALKRDAGRAWNLVEICVPRASEIVTPATFHWTLRWSTFKTAARRDGHYILRTNLRGEDPAVLWHRYIQLTEIEAAFKTLKSDLAIRPVHHHIEQRVEAHIFVAFLAYCLVATLILS